MEGGCGGEHAGLGDHAPEDLSPPVIGRRQGEGHKGKHWPPRAGDPRYTIALNHHLFLGHLSYLLGICQLTAKHPQLCLINQSKSMTKYVCTILLAFSKRVALKHSLHTFLHQHIPNPDTYWSQERLAETHNVFLIIFDKPAKKRVTLNMEPDAQILP